MALLISGIHDHVISFSLQIQVEFSAPTDCNASVVVLGDSAANLYDAHSSQDLKQAARINLEPLQFHMHGGHQLLLGWVHNCCCWTAHS